MTVKIDIITICFNNAEGLKKTFESIIEQRDHINNYIVIDGGSNDGTDNLLKEYENIIDVIVSEPDDGIYSAMNKGLKYANEDSYILYLNSSDFLEPNAISKVKEAIEQEDVYHGLLNFISTDGSVLKVKGRSVEMLDYKMIEHPASFVRKSLITRVGGFDESYSSAADYDLFLKLRKAGASFKLLPIVISNFDITGVSSSNIKGALESLSIRRKYNCISYFRCFLSTLELRLKSFFKKIKQ